MNNQSSMGDSVVIYTHLKHPLPIASAVTKSAIIVPTDFYTFTHSLLEPFCCALQTKQKRPEDGGGNETLEGGSHASHTRTPVTLRRTTRSLFKKAEQYRSVKANPPKVSYSHHHQPHLSTLRHDGHPKHVHPQSLTDRLRVFNLSPFEPGLGTAAVRPWPRDPSLPPPDTTASSTGNPLLVGLAAAAAAAAAGTHRHVQVSF